MRVGFLVEDRLGDHGGFFYPKEGLVATAVTLHDVKTLQNADPTERLSIMDLKNNPVQEKEDLSAWGKKLEVIYNLQLAQFQTMQQTGN